MGRSLLVAALALPALGLAGLGAWSLRKGTVTPSAVVVPRAPAGGDVGPPSLPPGVRIRFVDVAAASGVNFRHVDGRVETQYIMDAIAPGLAWLDYDGDGLMDLFVVQGTTFVGPPPSPTPTCKLFRNEGGGRFRDVTEATGVGHVGCGQGAAVGDIDNDGDPDLFVSCYGKPHALYRNEGGRSFTEVAAEAGLVPAAREGPNWGTSAAFLDYDNDGFLDLFVCQYVRVDLDHYPVCLNASGTRRATCHPSRFAPSRCELYRNRGDGTFADVSREAGVDLPEAKGLGVVALDLDDDGLVDLFVANDDVPNFFFRNAGGGRFESAGLASGCAVNLAGETQAYMGVDADDLDGDGRPDIYATAYAQQTDTLFRNEGGGSFLDVTPGSGLARPSWLTLGFGTCFLDPDQDGALDIVVVNGHVERYADGSGEPGDTFRQRAQFYRNDDGRGHFTEISGIAGPYFHEPHVGRGVGPCDYDNDGRMDLAVANSGEPTALLHNESQTPNHWLRLELRGTKSNRDAVGAKVTVRLPGGRRLVRHRKGGGAYLSSADPRLLIGLGAAGRAEGVEIRWPSGLVQRLGPLEADRGYLASEGSDRVEPRP